jgi:hypothetical protein
VFWVCPKLDYFILVMGQSIMPIARKRKGKKERQNKLWRPLN